MGAWGLSVLSNDTALDTMGDLSALDISESEDRHKLKSWVKNMLEATPDSSIWHAADALLAVAIVDSSFHPIDKEVFGGLYDYDKWFDKLQKHPMKNLTKKAYETCDIIRDNDWVGITKEDRIARGEVLDGFKKRLEQVIKEQKKEKDEKGDER